MALSNWGVYALAVLILTASPGPSVLLCVTKSVTGGFRCAFCAALGSLLAIVSIMTLSFSGLGVVIATSDIAFSLMKWAGAIYLIYIGVQLFRSAKQDFDVPASRSDSGSTSRPVEGTALEHGFSGFVVGASNPKAILFFTALFPQFIDTQTALLPQYVIMASTFAVMELFWLSFYAALASRSSAWLSAPGRALRFNQITGGVFVGAGLWLSTVSRAPSP